MREGDMNFDGFWILRNGDYAQIKDNYGTIYNQDGKKIYKSRWNNAGFNLSTHSHDLMQKLTIDSPSRPEWSLRLTSQES